MTLRSTGHPVQLDGASHLLSFVICYLSSAICRLTSFIDSSCRLRNPARRLDHGPFVGPSRDDRTDLRRYLVSFVSIS